MKKDWEEEFKEKMVDELWTNFRDKLGKLVEKHVPCREIKMGKVRKPMWMTYRALRAVKQKKNSWKKLKKEPTIRWIQMSTQN